MMDFVSQNVLGSGKPDAQRSKLFSYFPIKELQHHLKANLNSQHFRNKKIFVNNISETENIVNNISPDKFH
jgi:hypothetical protein